MRKVILFAIAMLSMNLVFAQNKGGYYLSCAPKNRTSNVFIKPDLNSKWMKNSEFEVGLGSTFIAYGTVFNKDGVFLKGDLLSTRGGKLNNKENGVVGDFYVLFKDWQCDVYH
jgi:hypothetical protein